MDTKKRTIFLAILLIIVTGFSYYFYTKNLKHPLTASGTIEATEIIVSSKVVGRITELKVDEGDPVSSNETIALIEKKELNANLANAQSRYNLAQDEFKRSAALYEENVISRQQYDISKSNLEIAKAAFDLANLQYDNSTIISPVTGIVIVREIEKGELAVIGTPIFTLADLREVKLTVYLPAQDIGKIKLGEEVFVYVDSYPNEKFTGKISHISNKAEFTPKSIQTKEERTTQVFGVRIKISNLDMKLKPGMPADAEFKWNTQ